MTILRKTFGPKRKINWGRMMLHKRKYVIWQICPLLMVLMQLYCEVTIGWTYDFEGRSKRIMQNLRRETP